MVIQSSTFSFGFLEVEKRSKLETIFSKFSVYSAEICEILDEKSTRSEIGSEKIKHF